MIENYFGKDLIFWNEEREKQQNDTKLEIFKDQERTKGMQIRKIKENKSMQLTPNLKYETKLKQKNSIISL